MPKTEKPQLSPLGGTAPEESRFRQMTLSPAGAAARYCLRAVPWSNLHEGNGLSCWHGAPQRSPLRIECVCRSRYGDGVAPALLTVSPAPDPVSEPRTVTRKRPVC